MTRTPQTLPDTWQLKDNYIVSAAWLSKRNERRGEAEQLTLAALSQGEEAPLLAQLALDDSPPPYPGWYHLFIVQIGTFYEGFDAVLDGVKSFLKRSDFGPGDTEFLLDNRAAPVRLSKSQRVKLIDTFMKRIKDHDFPRNVEGESLEEGEPFDLITPFGDYALRLSVEFARFRDSFDTTFGAEDNPVRSLVGLACEVYGWPFEPQDEDEEKLLPVLGGGVPELNGTAVRVGDWQHTFDADDKVVDSVAFEEVNVISEALEMTVVFERQSSETNERKPTGDE